MKNLVIAVFVLAGTAYAGAKAYLHNEVADAMDAAVVMMSPYADVRYDGVASTMSGELTIEGLHIQMREFRDDIRIDRVGIDTPSFLHLLEISDYVTLQGDRVPDYFGFLIEGARIPVDADYYDDLYRASARFRGVADSEDAAAICSGKYGFSPESLADLGYDEQVFSMSMVVRNKDSRFSMEVDSSIENMWELNANLTLAGDLMSELSKGTSYRPRLSELRIEYADRSLNERVRKYCGRLGLSEDETLQAQMDAFMYQGESNGIVFDEYVLEPYLEFLNGKNNITITASPNEPIAMSQIHLYKASDVPALLNLEARAH